jgi:hypothetical protein
MKRLLISAIGVLVSASTFAETLKLQCDLGEDQQTLELVNSFSGRVVLTIQEDGATFADLVLSTRSRGRDSKPQLVIAEELAGQRVKIGAGQLMKEELQNFELTSNVEGQPNVSLNLTLGLPNMNAHLIDENGDRFSSKCSIESREE